VDVLLGVLLGVVLTASGLAVSRLAAPRRVLAPGEEGVRAALHAAAATLLHRRRGLTRESAGRGDRAPGRAHAGRGRDDRRRRRGARGRRAARRGRLAAGLRARRGRQRSRALRAHGGRGAVGAGDAGRAAGRVLRDRAASAAGGHPRRERGRIAHLLPGLHDARLLGVPLPIWLVVVPPFPLFFAIRLLEQRQAEGVDEAFRELVENE
jgi:hypothetical protein